MTDKDLPEFKNPPDQRLFEILTSNKYVAILGLTPDQNAASHRVARFLKRHGFQIYPVNPRYPTVLGEPSRPYLRNITGPVDIVEVFRRPEHLTGIVPDALQVGAKIVWLQLGTVNPGFAREAQDAGLEVVMNKCMKKEFERLVLKRNLGRRHAP